MASGDDNEKMAVNRPVFYLIQEQAKSVVAIQALQSRMAVLESLQERLMQAINDVHQHLASSSKETKNLKVSSKRKFESKSDLSKSDSLNKDSGISSDNSLTTTNHEDDELLQLLELIDQRSVQLLKQIEIQQDTEPEMADGRTSELLDNLLFEKTDVHRQLSEVKAERDVLRDRLEKLELATETVSKQRTRIQQQLDATLEENQSLQDRIQHEGGRKSESLGYMADLERANVRRKYLQYSEKSRVKVSAILKEGNVLELQKQLLAYVMENDILRAKLQQDEPSKVSKWLKIESGLRKELEELKEGNRRFQEILQSKDIEIASLKDRIRCLEDEIEGVVEEESDSCVKNFGMASNDDWREPGAYAKCSNLNATAASPYSPLGYGDFSKTQSLPAILLLGAQSSKFKETQDSMRANYNHIYDTGSFTEIPLSQSSQSGFQVDSKDLVDLSSSTTQFPSSTSTLVQSNQYSMQPNVGLSTPNLAREPFQNYAYNSPPKQNANGGAKLINGHLCWKGRQQSTSEDLSSICTEFDPLSEDSPSCENFVDSLNLSIPLKPTVPMSQVPMSQLSSIGDSLHSASLDMACPTPCLNDTQRKVLSAKSVDGIRDMLLENKYCKRPASSVYGNASVMSGRHKPANIMNCMHACSEYPLL